MSNRTYRLLQFLILVGSAIFMIAKYATGNLAWYVNQRFQGLTVVAIVGFFGMALAVISSSWTPRHHHDHDHEHEEREHSQSSGNNQPVTAENSFQSAWSIVFLFLPLIIGLAIPAKPLSASAIDTRGISKNPPLSAGGVQTTNGNKPAEERTVLDWIKLFNYQSDLSPFLGQKANVIGFVYHDPRLPAGDFLVGRFAITCCVADAFAIGMVVQSEDAGQYPENSWVNVKGPIQVITVDGQKIPLIQPDSILPVQQPAQPYLFP